MSVYIRQRCGEGPRGVGQPDRLETSTGNRANRHVSPARPPVLVLVLQHAPPRKSGKEGRVRKKGAGVTWP